MRVHKPHPKTFDSGLKAQYDCPNIERLFPIRNSSLTALISWISGPLIFFVLKTLDQAYYIRY
jgi:hypothetical protein